MYVNDPSQLAQLPEVKKEVEFEEPRDYHEFFGDDQAKPFYLPPRPTVRSERLPNFGEEPARIHTQVCRFNERGEHVSMAKDCPHFDGDDEMGKKIVQGWTAQVR